MMETFSHNFTHKLYELKQLGLEINPIILETSNTFDNTSTQELSITTFFSSTELSSEIIFDNNTNEKQTEKEKFDSIVQEGIGLIDGLKKEIQHQLDHLAQQKEECFQSLSFEPKHECYEEQFDFICFPNVNKFQIIDRTIHRRKNIQKKNPKSSNQLFSPQQRRRITKRKHQCQTLTMKARLGLPSINHSTSQNNN
ncbi:hypothetical protein M0812_13838 [Anaeramoeba flamelloides]|uniref:Uncharacterized protein n=1 Tax=Anaeramoeba flamelloides TaxID=1746091 RepID=A0AAV7ZPB3_9EUKA|nr:hypothetical protein M0812_13838 [Anaeramoeba flamelloides]